MPIININPLHTMISVIALSGIFVHGVQAESLVTADYESRNGDKSELLLSGKNIHTEASTFTGNTFDLRSQQAANRPRDDEDRDNLAKRRSIGDGFGTDYSSSANL